jgi:hypothetical protein
MEYFVKIVIDILFKQLILYQRPCKVKEKDMFYKLMVDDKESGYRAKIILLKADGYTVHKIRRATTNHHDINI